MMYCLPICALDKQYWFDRYLIICLPLAMMVAILSTNPGRIPLAGVAPIVCVIALVLLYAAVTIAGTHDYLASSRVRWQAINYALHELRISPDQINGGFEFEGWYFANRLAICNPQQALTPQRVELEFRSFTCLEDDPRRQYTISYLPQPGYSVQAQYSFKTWLPWREQRLYLLHRNPVADRGVTAARRPLE
jgi:hypothetical protein